MPSDGFTDRSRNADCSWSFGLVSKDVRLLGLITLMEAPAGPKSSSSIRGYFSFRGLPIVNGVMDVGVSALGLGMCNRALQEHSGAGG